MNSRMTETEEAMKAIARDIDKALNKDGVKRIGFTLLVMPFDAPVGARVNYVSNADRRDVVAMKKEVTARFEGQPHQSGRA